MVKIKQEWIYTIQINIKITYFNKINPKKMFIGLYLVVLTKINQIQPKVTKQKSK